MAVYTGPPILFGLEPYKIFHKAWTNEEKLLTEYNHPPPPPPQKKKNALTTALALAHNWYYLWDGWDYTGCPPKKAKRQIFSTLGAKSVIFVYIISECIYLLRKRMIPRSLNLNAHFLKYSHFQILLDFCH